MPRSTPGGPTEYPAHYFPSAAKSRRKQGEHRKVATLRELAKLPQDQLERALEAAKAEQPPNQQQGS